MKLSFVGLGVMGFPMAGHLANAGHDVSIFNRTQSKAEAWVKTYSGNICATVADAAINADIIFTCIGNDDDLRDVILGETGLLQAMKPGAVIVDHTTASATVAQALYGACKSQQIGFIDAPVSGGEQGAINGQLTIMCGGDVDVFARVEPVISIYAKKVCLMGPSGNGQLTKMVNQITICGLIQSLSEGLLFAEKAGLDQQKVIEVISKGAAQSWQMDNRHKTMIAEEYEHGFAVDLMRKDLTICLTEATKFGASIPIAALVDQFYQDVQNMGGGRWDTSSLLARLKKLS